MCSTLTNQLGTALYINGVSDLQREGDGEGSKTNKNIFSATLFIKYSLKRIFIHDSPLSTE